MNLIGKTDLESCSKCKMLPSKSYFGWMPILFTNYWFCPNCSNEIRPILDGVRQRADIDQEKMIQEFIQPERSKREDSQKCEMRCSEHCGNTVRDK